jgi:hypothetical protein
MTQDEINEMRSALLVREAQSQITGVRKNQEET